jgi:NAD(P)-dependent dehydrogenase (short-subunit alcohol dehydrogenase family)
MSHVNSASEQRRSAARGSVVLVVGASSGIGRAAAQKLAERGHRVFGSARNAERVDLADVQGISLEISDPASVRQALAEVTARAGRLDAVVYSAGFYIAGAVEETSDELAAEQFDVYFFGAHRLARAVLPVMRAQGHGRLIFMSSTAAVAAIPFHALYSSTKAALEHYVDGLRYETEPFGIQVACIQGGGVRTAAAGRRRSGAPVVPAYEPARSRALEAFKRMQETGPEPALFAEAICRALEAERMRPLYRAGPYAHSLPLLKAALPQRLFRLLFYRFFTRSTGALTAARA